MIYIYIILIWIFIIIENDVWLEYSAAIIYKKGILNLQHVLVGEKASDGYNTPCVYE